MAHENTSNRVMSLIDTILGAIGLITIIIVSLGVFTRFILQVSIAWSDELLRTVFVWAYFIGSAMQYRSEGLMRLELLDLSIKEKEKVSLYKGIMLIQDASILVFATMLIYYSIKIISTQIINNQVTTTSGTPAWITTSGFLIGMILIVLFSIHKLHFTIKLKELN